MLRRNHRHKESDTKHHHPWITIAKGTSRAMATVPDRTSDVQTASGQHGILDSGTASHFVTESFVGSNPGPVTPGDGPVIECPNGTIMTTTGTDELNLPQLPRGTREHSRLKDLRVPLVSIKQLCHNGLYAAFFGNKAHVCNNEGNVVLEGECGPDQSDLHMVPLDGVNTSSGLNAARHPAHKAAKPAPASQTNSARKHSVCAIKPLKSVRGSPARPSHLRAHRDNTRRITRSGEKPFPPEQTVPHVSAITRQL